MPEDRSLSPIPPPPPPPPPDTVIEPYRPPRQLATTLLVFLGIGLALDVIGALSSWAELSLLERAQGEGISFDEAQANDVRQGAIALFQLLVFLIIIIVFIVWFRRAYRNLPSLGARNLRFKPGWAVGGWFVPFLNWVRPVQIMNDIWKASDPEAVSSEDSMWQTRSSSALIGFWWASWVLSNFVGQYSFTSANRSGDLDQLQQVSRSFIAADTSSAIATVFAIAVVWRATARQEERARRLFAGA